MPSLLRSVFCLLPVLIMAAWFCPVHAAEQPRFEPSPCPFDLPAGESVTCGYLLVPENRTRSDRAMIRIFVAVVKSHSPQPVPDPLIYLRGGMGRPTQWFIEHELSQVQAWLAKRDVILFDQRGLGRSQPALDCPAVHDSVLQVWLGANPTLAEQLAPRLACRDGWLQQRIDLAAYNSFETAADVAALGPALGYEQINLIGASYWTVVAQLVLRDHNQAGQIRSVILDSPMPLTAPVMADTPAQLSASLARLFQKCSTDWSCRLAYPGLEVTYGRVIERLQAAPMVLTATHPPTGEPFSFPFTIVDFGFFFQYAAYRDLPRLIYDIYDGDYRQVIVAREVLIREASYANAGQHFGFRTTMACNEPWQTVSVQQRAAMSVYPEAVFMDNPLDVALCQQWPSFTPAPQTLASGDVPALVLTGEQDTRLPAAYGDLIIGSLRHGHHFHVPGASHITLAAANPCSRLMALSFLDDPTRPPASGCLASAGSPGFDTPFVIRAAAMRRPVQLLVGLLTVVIVSMSIRTSLSLGRPGLSNWRSGWAWSHSLRLLGWPSLAVSSGLIGLAAYAGQTQVLPLQASEAVAWVLPILVAGQAAFAFSPEDEPALEILLAAPRPPAWMLLERLAILFMAQGSIGLAASLLLVYLTGQPLSLIVNRWLPLLLGLSGLAIAITIITRRAILGILLVTLVWLSLALFGDFALQRWPLAWPLHLYLAPDHADYLLNRLFISLLGLSLMGLAAWRLKETEFLLLGRPRPWRRLPSPLAGPSVAAQAEKADRLPHFQSVVLTQLGAMIRYEFLMQWRRAVWPALVVGLMVTPLLGAVIARADFQGYQAALANGALAPEVAAAEITAKMIPVMWLGVVLTSMLLLPLTVADTIPRDQQEGMRELLDSLPLPPAAYLAGKLFSLWLSLLTGLSLTALMAGGVWWLGIGPFELALFLDMWFVGAALLLAINAGFSLLLAAGQPSQRRAVWVGGGYVLLSLVGLSFAFAEAGGWQWLNPARPAVVLYYLLGFPGAVQGHDAWTQAGLALIQRVASQDMARLSLVAGLVQVGVLWLIVWQVFKRRKR